MSVALVYFKKLDLNPVFYLLLAIAGNFLAETLGCQTQKVLADNIFVKQLVIFSLIFFTLTLGNGSKKKHPRDNFKTALVYFVLFLFITKTPLMFSMLIMADLALMFVVQQLIAYKKQEGEDVEKEEKFLDLLNYVFIGLLVLGFLIYLQKQYNDFGEDFNAIKFLFGTIKCDPDGNETAVGEGFDDYDNYFDEPQGAQPEESPQFFQTTPPLQGVDPEALRQALALR